MARTPVEPEYILSDPVEVSIDKLTLHPKVHAREVDPDEQRRFDKDIAQHGVRDPIIVTPGNEILNGRRRFTAAKKADRKKILVRYVKSELTDTALRQIIFGMNNQAKNWSFEEQVANVIKEYGRNTLLATQAGGSRYRGKIMRLDEIVSMEFLISEARAREILSAARKQLKGKTTNVGRNIPDELKERIRGALQNYVKKHQRVEKIEAQLKEEKDLLRGLEKTLKPYGGPVEVAGKLKVKIPKELRE